MNIEKLERKRKEIISDFSEKELINYVQQLTETYYSSYFNNDVEAYNNVVKYLKEVISIFKYAYPNLNYYINYCLLYRINKILSGTISSDVELVPISEITTEEITANTGIAMLCKAFEEGRENFHKRQEEQKRLLELEQENRQLKEQLKEWI